ncbi:hypothetical protein F401_gp13 [Aeromonas phage phiAS7]|uniref:Uncharacterized protein n=1 Tax=Aeromonas phage phiAS7 TaxID=1141132 RepID=H6UK20_9CAUD|nr:hypothetical protein F401_gp13 [Aeromonas phage phiAS7]AEZ65038.1 hypothetical protein phiAS7_00013 [Aeromonas phage phiAS7]
MARTRNRRTGKHPAHGAPYGQGPARQSEAYRQTIADRKARQLAKQRAEVEIANMHFTSEGDFSHLAAQPMRIRHA